ncbi:hypothetical protein [Virgisporangium aurantiacum]|uniref:Uncharacterized protein n=1 Tax=Virgisporangium aurantiacum TaxID=175570 RepID=A0A8J3ZKP5_9ACTN|nr:hypothetical protein [Virgisporangium aurantiacum]GIJ64732.1 hypothetical protein Vau01_122480 [Virgisporangium aurantiacum]
MNTYKHTPDRQNATEEIHQLFCEVFDLVDVTVDGVTDAEINAKLQHLLARSHPVATDIEINANRQDLLAGGRPVGIATMVNRLLGKVAAAWSWMTAWGSKAGGSLGGVIAAVIASAMVAGGAVAVIQTSNQTDQGHASPPALTPTSPPTAVEPPTPSSTRPNTNSVAPGQPPANPPGSSSRPVGEPPFPASSTCPDPRIPGIGGPQLVRITYPRDRATVPAAGFLVDGVRPPGAPAGDLWILAYYEPLGRYWIQSPNANPVQSNPDGAFSTPVGFGSTTGDWQLVAVLAGPSASNWLSATKQRWDTDKKWPGLRPTDLPDLTEAACITITAA